MAGVYSVPGSLGFSASALKEGIDRDITNSVGMAAKGRKKPNITDKLAEYNAKLEARKK